MEDLIFHGTGARKPVGLAEVELTFSNDGTLSVPWSEIGVARRLYRTGESEYLLNRQPTRLRDILDLFAGTGANPRAYSVMDQDKLNHVLTAKPHERRVFIEEAAGIARYKQQRNETQGKLDGARQNLTRVRDVMDEVRRQLGSLERQARKAQQYKALQGERRELALALVAADFAGLTAQAEAHGRRSSSASATPSRACARARPGWPRARRGSGRALQASEHRLSDLRQSVQKIQGELERLLERREQMGVQLQELGEEARPARRGDAQRRRAARAPSWASAPPGSRRAGRGRAARCRARRGRAGAGGRGGEPPGRAWPPSATAWRRCGWSRCGWRPSAWTSCARPASCASGRRSWAAGPSAWPRSWPRPRRRPTRSTGQRASLESARDLAVSELTSLVAERERLGAALADRAGRLAEAEARLAQARLDLASRSSSRDAVRELEVAREGYGAGVRAVFAEGATPVLTGVVGTVADLLEVEPGLERAVESVLGERLQWVVVERFEHARGGGGVAARARPRLGDVPAPREARLRQRQRARDSAGG